MIKGKYSWFLVTHGGRKIDNMFSEVWLVQILHTVRRPAMNCLRLHAVTRLFTVCSCTVHEPVGSTLYSWAKKLSKGPYWLLM